MSDREHHYTVTTTWTGDRGTGTSAYRAYGPNVTLAEGSDAAIARALHHQAHESCYVASSVNFSIECEPV